ncbi:MAG TPA: glycosyltransferase [Ferruginibacter sp.]|jgi:GT2 family glycosyltransferase/ubiquinone/menaquinone biosynthesis C-methylase UbiE|nr:glycosyltransferase [Ferruginibacter sp.]
MKFTGERFIPTKDLMDDEIGYEHLHRYYTITELVKNKAVLDIACGEGYGSVIIAAHATKVVGVDIDEETVKYAIEQYASKYNNVEFQSGSATSIPLDDKLFDVVVSFETIEHLSEKDQQLFMLEIKRVLRPDGVLIMSTPNKKIYSEQFSHTNSFHLHEFEKEEFHAFIKQHFVNISFFDQGYEVVSIISNASAENAGNIHVVNWENNNKGLARKYIVAIASNASLPDSFNSVASVVSHVNKDYLALMERLVSMNKEIEELGNWGKSLDVQLLKLQKESTQLRNDSDRKITYLKQQLDISRQEYQAIATSKKWRFITMFSGMKKKYFSHNSPVSIKINSFINRFKKNKRNKLQIKKNDLTDYTQILILPIFDHPVVSIVIPAYNGWKMNYKCIKSIIDNTQSVAYEIILADDCSTDETKDITSRIKNIVHVRNEKNLGFLGNCNNAAKSAKGDFILFLNNDTEVTDNWLLPLVTLIKSDDTIGMVGSKLIYPDGRLQEAGGIVWNDASAWNYGNGQDPRAPEFNYVKEVDYISGAAIMIRKSVWLKAGGFDERYAPAYYEDTDFAFQVREQGYKVMYQPLSEVIHYEGYSNGTDKDISDPQSIKSFQTINHKKFSDKWKELLLQENLPNAQNVFNARDKTIGKKTILVVDHYVPQFDKDAGSRATFQYLEVLVSLGLNVKFIGDNFFKDEPYTTALQQLGIEVLYGPWYKKHWKDWLKDNADNIDFVILSRPHISEDYIDFVKENTNAKVLYIGHDLHFLREERQSQIENNQKLQASSAKWKEREMSLFSKSDIILTFSDVEQKIISALDPVYRVETMLLNNFKVPAVPINDFSSRKDFLFIGGFNHKPNADAVLWFCKEVFPIVQKQIPSVKFIIAGSFPPEEITALQNDSINVKGFVTEQELSNLYNSVKMAVIPLRYGAGVKGKTVEALYKGLPIISTNIGIEGMPGDQNFLQGFDEPDAFAAQIILLYTSENLLRNMSIDGVNYINQYFTHIAAANKMKSLLELK